MVGIILRILVLVISWTFVTSIPATPIQISEVDRSVDLTQGILYHISNEPPSIKNHKDLEILDWKPSKQKIFSIGYSKNTVTSYIPLEFSDDSHRMHYLTLDFPSLDRIEFWIFDPKTEQSIYHTLTGDLFPFSERPILNEVFVFPIEKPTNGNRLDIVLVTKTTGSHKLPFILETPDAFQERIAGKYFIWGLFLGLIFTFFLLSLVLFIFTGKRELIFFILYTFTLLWLFLSGFGLGYRYIFPELVFVQNNLFIVTSSMSASFKILFYIFFLRTGTLYPLYFRYLLVIIGIYILSTVAFILTEVPEFYTVVLILGPVSIISLIILSILSLKFDSTAKYFLIAEISLLIGVVTSTLTMIGIISHNNITYQIFLWTVGIELLILSIAVGKQIYKLKLEKETAESASRVKGIFLSTMSHEIRTPLNGVLGFLELLDSTDLDETQKEYVTIARQSGKSLLFLIGDILDFSKMEAGKLELFTEKSSLKRIINESVQSISPLAKKKGLFLDWNLIETPEFILVDHERLKQVLINLMGNAVKFTEEGNIHLEISFNEIDSEIGLFKFQISDTGIGIKPDEIENLFQAFTQVESGTMRRYEGSGLGLAISDSLVRSMGGSIQVESRYGKGSKFAFTITTNYWRDKSEDINDYKPLEIDSLPLTLPEINTILIAEDDISNLLIVIKMLEKYLPGVRILKAKNGIEVLEILEIESVQLILMDIQMPKMDGLTATTRIRNHNNEKIRSLPVIGLSANAFPEEIEKAKSLGMNDYITKPINKKILIQVIGYYFV